MKQTDLTTLPGCLQEIEDCTRGLAYLDHFYGIIIDRLSEAEHTYESLQADAFRAARQSTEEKLTAGEVKGRVWEWMNATPERQESLEEYRTLQDQRQKAERWLRSLEKRLSAAQSASKAHEALGRYGGAA